MDTVEDPNNASYYLPESSYVFYSFPECGELGTTDENRSINDTAFKGSTFQPGFEPYKARLNGHFAWCALINDQHQYLEIDLGKYW